MKKLLLSALALCMALCVSCKKDSDSAASSGGNNGGGNGGGTNSELKRLHEIYQKEDSSWLTWNNETQTWDTVSNHVGHFSLTQTVNWNGDKIISFGDNNFNLEYNNDGLVSKIVHKLGSNGEADTAYFYYNGDNQIIKMDRYEYIDFPPNEPFYEFTTWDITYSNGKPINATSSNGLSMQATWTGDNITELQYIENSRVICRETFTYDNCYNFNYGFKCMEAISMAGGKSFGGFTRYTSFVSKNNVINYQSTYDESWSNILSDENIDYHYTYSGNYPIERVHQDYSETETHISTVTYTTKYVYLN